MTPTTTIPAAVPSAIAPLVDSADPSGSAVSLKHCCDCPNVVRFGADRCVSCSAKRGNFFVRNPKSPNQMKGDVPWHASVQEEHK